MPASTKIFAMLLIFTVVAGHTAVAANTPDRLDGLYQKSIRLYRQGRYDSAIETTERYLEAVSTMMGKYHEETTKAYNNAATIYRLTGRYDKAEELLIKALSVDKVIFGDKDAHVARDYRGLGELYAAMGYYSKAENNFRKALSALKAAGKGEFGSIAGYTALASLYVITGRYSEAEPLFQKALEAKGSGEIGAADLYHGMALLYRKLGFFGRAERLERKALAIYEGRKGPIHPALGKIYHGLGMIYRDTGYMDRAEKMFRKAIKAKKATLGEGNPATLRSEEELAVLHVMLGRLDVAQELLEQVNFIHETAQGTETTGDGHRTALLLASLYLERGGHEQAKPLFQAVDSLAGVLLCDIRAGKALEEAGKRLTEDFTASMKEQDLDRAVGDLIVLSEYHVRRGEQEKAISALRRAVEIVETENFSLRPGDTAFVTLRPWVRQPPYREIYERLIHLLLASGGPKAKAEALRVAERLKAKELVELAATRPMICLRDMEMDVSAENRGFLERLNFLEAERRKLASRGKDSGRLSAVKREIAAVKAKYRRFLEGLGPSPTASLFRVRVPSSSSMLYIPGRGTRIVEFFLGEHHSWAWVLSWRGVETVELEVTGREAAAMLTGLIPGGGMEETLRKELDIIQAPGGMNAPMVASGSPEALLKERLWRPVATLLQGARHVIIIPDGPLFCLPFSIFLDQDGDASGHFTLSLLPSLSVLQHLSRPEASFPASLMAIADPRPEAMPMKGTDALSRYLTRYFPRWELYPRDQGLELIFKSISYSFEAIYLGVPAGVSDLQPLDSALMLRPDRTEDGIIHLNEIAPLNLARAEIVVLATVQWDRYGPDMGMGTMALVNLFFHAGAKALILNLWNSSDAAGDLFVREFFKNWLGRGMTKSLAMKRAWMAVDKNGRGAHAPGAPFVLFGLGI